MKSGALRRISGAMHFAPWAFLGALLLIFGASAPQFLTLANLSAILAQSSWLIALALGQNFVLLSAGVDLSVGAAMYLAALAVGLGLSGAPVGVCLIAASGVGAAWGALNGLLIVRLRLPAFIVTLATAYVGRGMGLYLSDTRLIVAARAIADFGRETWAGVPAPLCLAAGAALLAALALRATPFGVYIRAAGADVEGARRAGVPTGAVILFAYALCGMLAGLGGFISLSQTSAASAAFGQNAEFLAIAAAILGGTSLFGGRGTFWAPLIGAILITTIQNGLALINANPYAYPIITGGIIFVAALLDALRMRAQARLERPRFALDAGSR